MPVYYPSGYVPTGYIPDGYIPSGTGGGLGAEDNTALTPYRRTTLRIDVDGYALCDPAFSYEREYAEIGKGKSAQKSQVHYIDGIGWTLASYSAQLQVLHEEGGGDSSAVTPGVDGIGAGLLVARPVQRKLTDYNPMVGGGYDARVTSSGDNYWQLSYPAGVTTPSVLTADQTAFPSPETSLDNAPMDRVLVSSNQFEPDRYILIRFGDAAAGHRFVSSLITVYFTGPAGIDEAWTGSGRYSLKIYATGEMRLFEMASDSATWRKCADYYHKDGFAEGFHTIAVSTDSYYDNGWKGRAVAIRVSKN